MIITRTEFGHEYEKYRFGYCEYAVPETGEALTAVYANGFLPYSARPTVLGSFYMARSARVPLALFEPTSENRRVLKRFDSTFVRSESPAHNAPQHIKELFLSYFTTRHGASVMPIERLEAILEAPLPLTLITYHAGEKLIAGALEVREPGFRHFWFSAYDPVLVHQSLGMWLMLDGAREAKNQHIPFYYLGTVYGEKALYKANLEPLEFWSGSEWIRDIKQLKALARTESVKD